MNCIKFVGRIFLVVSSVCILKVVSASSYSFSMIPYRVNDICDLEIDGGQNCLEKVLDGEISDNLILNQTLEANDLVMILVNLQPSSDSNLLSADLSISVDLSKMKVVQSFYGIEFGVNERNINEKGGIFPVVGRRSNWYVVSPDFYEDGTVRFRFFDTKNSQSLVKSGMVLALYYQVSSNVIDGEVINFHFRDEDSSLKDKDGVSINHEGIYEDLVLTVLGGGTDSESRQLQSDVYTMNREYDIPYVYGSNSYLTIEDYLKEYKNKLEYLHVYNSLGIEVINHQEFVKTGMKIKLIIEGTVYDELTIVVKGDINGDGLVNLIDLIMVSHYLNKIISFDNIQMLAGDLNFDGIINSPDFVKIKNYCDGSITSLNE